MMIINLSLPASAAGQTAKLVILRSISILPLIHGRIDGAFLATLKIIENNVHSFKLSPISSVNTIVSIRVDTKLYETRPLFLSNNDSDHIGDKKIDNKILFLKSDSAVENPFSYY